MATIQDIFNRLVADSEIVVLTGNLRAHENLRIRLVKLYSAHKKIMADIGDVTTDAATGISANFSRDSGHSSFRVNIPKRYSTLDYKIIEVNKQ